MIDVGRSRAHRRSAARHPRRAVTVVAVAAAFTFSGAGPASAHAFLVSATPQPGDRLDASPSSITLRFSEPIAGGERIVVKAVDGSRVTTGRIQRLEGGLVVEVPLPPLRDGVYVVSWQVLGADGDLSLGEYAFAVGDAGRLPVLQPQAGGDVSWPSAAASWVLLIGLFLGFGGLASERCVWVPVGRNHGIDVPRAPVAPLLELALLGGAVQLLLVARDAIGGSEELTAPAWAAVLTSRPGLLATAQVLLVAYGLWLLAFKRTRPWALVPLGLAVSVAAVRGHAGTTPDWWAAPANVVHLLAVALWMGGLAHVILLAWRFRTDEARPALIQGIRRYSGLALLLVALAVATGGLVALSQFTAPTQLIHTTYGRTLLIKLVLVSAALALAYAARRRALGANPRPRVELLRRLIGPEGTALVGAAAAAVIMASAATPRSATATDQLLGPPPLSGRVERLAGVADALAVYLGAGQEQLQVRVLVPSGEPAAADIEIRGQSPDGRDIAIAPRPCGPGCATVAFPWQAGVTRLEVTASSREWGTGTVRFDVPWPPGREAPGLLRRVVTAMSSEPRITMVERVSSGSIGSAEATYSLTGAQFVAEELYAAGGAVDIRPVPSSTGTRALTLYLPGSSIWYRLDFDAQYLLRRETIVSPGHLIQRTFTYERDGRPPASR
ncbi:MAG: copper resistance protein CopC [Actinomycetota bacterium]